MATSQTRETPTYLAALEAGGQTPAEWTRLARALCADARRGLVTQEEGTAALIAALPADLRALYEAAATGEAAVSIPSAVTRDVILGFAWAALELLRAAPEEPIREAAAAELDALGLSDAADAPGRPS